MYCMTTVLQKEIPLFRPKLIRKSILCSSRSRMVMRPTSRTRAWRLNINMARFMYMYFAIHDRNATAKLYYNSVIHDF